ncbi:hypothetical protein MBLNU457_6938t1 [Dothideomycetes sp. NU457]
MSTPSTPSLSTPSPSSSTSASSSLPCHICTQMSLHRIRQNLPSSVLLSAPSWTCTLCRRPYCATHSSPSWAGVCEINHETYARRHPGRKGVWGSVALRDWARGVQGREEGKWPGVLLDEGKVMSGGIGGIPDGYPLGRRDAISAPSGRSHMVDMWELMEGGQ